MSRTDTPSSEIVAVISDWPDTRELITEADLAEHLTDLQHPVEPGPDGFMWANHGKRRTLRGILNGARRQGLILRSRVGGDVATYTRTPTGIRFAEAATGEAEVGH